MELSAPLCFDPVAERRRLVGAAERLDGADAKQKRCWSYSIRRIPGLRRARAGDFQTFAMVAAAGPFWVSETGNTDLDTMPAACTLPAMHLMVASW
jgi:hypothetical protein